MTSVASTAPQRVLALCADDFGLAPAISAGIARLARAQRLTEVSCITNSPHWTEDSALLRDLPASVNVGLHLNLTEGRPLSPQLARHWPQLPSLERLILQAHLRALPNSALRAELHAQIAAFIDTFGAVPKFIDGHQHVHHLPGVREIVLDLAEHVQPMPAVRSTGRVLGPGFGLKRWLIERTGGRTLERQLTQRVLSHNPALLGAYDFVDTDYRALMQRWLVELPPQGGLLFCHPGDPAAAGSPQDPIDPIAAARVRELAYLGSPEFSADLTAANVRLGTVWQLAGRQVSTSAKSP